MEFERQIIASKNHLSPEILTLTGLINSVGDLSNEGEIRFSCLSYGLVKSKAFSELVEFCRKAWQRNKSEKAVHVAQEVPATVTFALSDFEIVGMCLAKLFETNNGPVLYIDNVAILPEHRNKGIGTGLQAAALTSASQKEPAQFVVARTQNPSEISSLKSALKTDEWSGLSPLWEKPSVRLVAAISELTDSDKICRNPLRLGSFFDRESLIFFGAYGEKGDGTTWEDQTASFLVDWNHPNAQIFVGHINDCGISLNNFLRQGHALMIGAQRIAT